MDDLVSSPVIDRRFGWSIGRANLLARRGILPHYKLPDGSIRFRWSEVEASITKMPAKKSTAKTVSVSGDAEALLLEAINKLRSEDAAARFNAEKLLTRFQEVSGLSLFLGSEVPDA